MNTDLATGTGAVRVLSADELDVVSGGEVKFVDIGPVHIAVGDNLFAVAISGLGGFAIGDGTVCGAFGGRAGCL
jgi:uncharacterized protein (DUF2345 family)